MNTLQKITARNCGYLVESQMQTSYEVSPDKLQLQKLVYICFGYYGGVTEKYLFDDRIEAWQYGPVIPNLYHQGVEEITPPLEKSIEIIIKTVVQYYGKLSATRLVSLTHFQGTPWRKVYVEGEKNIEIPKSSILSYYIDIIGGLRFVSDSGILDKLAKT